MRNFAIPRRSSNAALRARARAGCARASGPDGDRAGHAGSAEPAIAAGVLGEILLVVAFGEVERTRFGDLGSDRPVTSGGQRLSVSLRRTARSCELLGGGRVDRRTVLRSDVIALAHALGRVMILPEDLEQILVGDFGWVVGDEHDLGVAGSAAAGLLVS